MPFNDVARLEMLVSTVGEARKIYESAINALDVLGTRPEVSSTIYQLTQLVLVVNSYNLRHGHVGSNGLWYTKLIQPEVRIWSNDRTS